MPEVESLEEKEKILGFVHELLKANGQPVHYSVLLDALPAGSMPTGTIRSRPEGPLLHLAQPGRPLYQRRPGMLGPAGVQTGAERHCARCRC